jgi:hypothetical protein
LIGGAPGSWPGPADGRHDSGDHGRAAVPSYPGLCSGSGAPADWIPAGTDWQPLAIPSGAQLPGIASAQGAQAVTEPSALALLGAGLVSLFAARERLRRRHVPRP